jgi:hypothetical protein
VPRADLEGVEVEDAAAVGGEVEGPAVRRPGRRLVERVVVGDEAERAAVPDRDVAPAALLHLQGDAAAVGGHSREEELGARALEERLGRAAVDPPAPQRVPAAGEVRHVHHRRAAGESGGVTLLDFLCASASSASLR